jgi:MacB-like protein/FtsX-like permease family protein
MLTDLRYALRQLARSPGFTAVAILTLALGIGACAAIFSVVNGVLLHPLNYPNSDRIVVLKATQMPQFPEFSVSPPDFMDWQSQSKSYVAVAAYKRTALNMTGRGEPERILGEKGTGHFFEVYSMTPVLGRAFSTEEDVPGKNQVVVISFSFWQRAFGGARDVLGRVVQFDGEPYTVIGVAPATFRPGAKVDAWVPMAFAPEETANTSRGSHDLTVVGRLKSAVTAAQADAELKLICAQLAQQYPDTNNGWSAYVMPLLDYQVKDVRVVLYTLLAAVGCVLLIACANVANLLLARATARHKEISIRAALGACRARLVRQLLTESILLALAGGVLGIFIANWGLHFLVSISPVPRSAEIHLDLGVLAFSLALSLATGVLFGLVPAWLTASANASEALKQASRGSTEGGARTRLRGVVVILELAFAVVLLAGTGLLVRSFMKLTHVDPGFSPENAVEFRLALPEKKYAKPEQQVAFGDALLTQLRALQGVRAVGLTHVMPLVLRAIESRGHVAAASSVTIEGIKALSCVEAATGIAKERIPAVSRVLSASGVATERADTVNRVVAAAGVAKERIHTVGRVPAAGGVVKERINPIGHVVAAGDVESERTNAIGCVVAAAGVVKERALTAGRVVEASSVVSERASAAGRVVDAGGVVRERSLTVGCIRTTSCVHKERKRTVGRVVAASGVERERQMTGGRVVAAGVVAERAFTQERGLAAEVAALITSRPRLRRKCNACEGEHDDKEAAYDPHYPGTRQLLFTR